MKLIETKVTDTTVHLRIANNHDAKLATQWIDFQVAISDLLDPRVNAADRLLRNVECQPISIVRKAALRRAQAVISGEIQEISSLEGRMP